MKISLPFSRLLNDRGGNFGIITAIVAPLAFGAAGIAIDITQAMQIKAELQAMADSASLAASKAMSEDDLTPAQAKERAEKIYAGQMVNYLKTGKETDAEIDEMIAAQKAALKITIAEAANGSRGKTYTITVASTYQMPVNAMTGLITGSNMNLATSSTAASATESTNGISMYLALDRSGSMSFKTSTVIKNASCVNYTENNWGNKNVTNTRDSRYIWPEKPCYVRKIDALKTAAGSMFTALNTADKNSNLVRVGAVSYTDETQSASSIDWGTSKAAKYVSNLPSIPEGGTDANGAMTAAINALKSSNSTEKDAHSKKGNNSFSRFIVLMTDGKMTGYSANFNYNLDQGVRAKCDAAKKDGIQVYTVAFMAPSEGKSLLNYCATDSSYYYEPDDMEDLVKAFGEIAEKAAKATTRLTN
ncbi:vWA domain-containing protein [Endobacterium cereale]|nr:TadE/TadG family type IV pilus assembly protein [Endobacterium cereale]MEB2845634.1 TadE/TadG family type IV pilus assembly protein [Endobacterium cereale]